jgi:hypothetical protein
MLDANEIKECSICGSTEVDDDELFVRGYIGILPVGFCSTCYMGIESMVRQMYNGQLPSMEDEE